MHRLESIAEQIRRSFDERIAARDQALGHARELIRACARAIRAAHREEIEIMRAHLAQARRLAQNLVEGLSSFPDLFYAGYAQDALKEFAEASITCALIYNQPLPSPQELEISETVYIHGLAESVGELRRRILDILRQGYSEEVERLLGYMDEIYSVLVTMDYPDGLTNNLRRQTDLVRGIVEKTRGDVLFALRSQHLEQAIRRTEQNLERRS
uniref:Translin family protein n=1 Tax=uncultured Chloroflexota bacterium TaxID=166587 RepID=H5SAJ7_9CHLR|nr:translin family protein [uncultured Chloroflexota bacterium]